MRVGTPDVAAPEDAGAEIASPRDMLRRFVQGDLASLRVILAIALIWIIFDLQNDRFLSATNLTNLFLQITAVGLISVGVVMALLIGEIDLSVGAVSGLAAAVMAVLNVKQGWDPALAIAAGVATGAAIGLLQGLLFTRFRIPSFVVTLAGLLTWQGALLLVLGQTGTVNLSNSGVTDLANTFYGPAVGWIFAAVAITAFALVTLGGHRRRVAAGVTTEPLPLLLVRIAVVAVVAIVSIAVLNSDRGLPLALLILLAFVIGFQVLATRTVFGRHLFAVGGNAEAARRAGIGVDRIRVIAFTLCSSMAAVGGILAASRLLAVNQSSGGSNLLLEAIAGPVIAGTSLFGGRGSVWSALLGAVVIGSIANGMNLLALESSVKYMITGGVLLAAVIVDAVARSRRQAEGRV
ncbi:MAG TPA: sugar ABC transporter permease [Solirubrobacterales bacterium]|nr:sugar ABC transporter permease [Solirubrobacterales bacterium]